jgi:hypothetical protein
MLSIDGSSRSILSGTETISFPGLLAAGAGGAVEFLQPMVKTQKVAIATRATIRCGFADLMGCFPEFGLVFQRASRDARRTQDWDENPAQLS